HGELNANSFNETRSPQKTKYESFEFSLLPGKYEVTIELYDLEIKKPFRKHEQVTIPDFRNQHIATTDIIFLNGINLNNLEELKPLIPPIRTAKDTSFCARIDLFSTQIKNVTIYESIQNNQGKTVYQDTVYIQMKNRRHPIFFKLNHDLPFGEYSFILRLVSGEHEKLLNANYYIRWHGHPTSISGMEMAIAPLSYIMNKDSWKNLNSAAISKQKQLIEDFWNQRDPVPETPINELEEEYYHRVAFANQNFSIFQGSQQGWKTARGHIYILYGPPTDVDVPPMRSENTSRYEIWIYQNLQQRFVFFDKYNDGDYRLISQE
ncbi:GWxTD domain-containing protein, partial [bacterium]